MTRQFAGLPMARQLYYAREYRRRFGGRIDLGRTPVDPVRVVNIKGIRERDRETIEALLELDEQCFAEANQ